MKATDRYTLLQLLEWSAIRRGQPTSMSGPSGAEYSACPNCGGIKPDEWDNGWIESAKGHKQGCIMGHLVRDLNPERLSR